MKRAFALLLSLVLVLCLLPAPAVLALSDAEEEDPAAFYLIGDEADSFSALYDRMCVNLRLKKQPLPEPDTEGEPFNASGEHEFVYVLKDDESSYEYIGYIHDRRENPKYIVWNWTGFHKDGSIIGMEVFYSLDGKYLGNIQHDYTAGTSTSSHRCPYYIPGEPINKD